MRSLLFLLASALALSAAESQLPQCPPDWKIEVIATAPDIRHPSVVCCAPDGRVFVAEDPMDISAPADARQGRIICFHPDGRGTIFADGLYAVFGLQYLEGGLFVLHNPKFTRFADQGERAGERVDLIESTHPNPWALDWNDHVPANFKLAMDGFFYIAVGDKGVYGAVGRDGRRLDMFGGGILRMRPDATGLEVYSTGVRNILDVALTEEDDIFTYDNTDENHWMGRVTHMVEQGFYGYPHDFIPQREYTLWMMDDFGAGAATGAFAYTEDALPESFRNNLFLADFGKRQLIRVRIERTGATFKVIERRDFFENPPEDFRPVGIALGADAKSIYICDWNHRDTKENVTVGRLLKLSYTGPTHPKPKPAWSLPVALGKSGPVPAEALAEGLSHPARSVRLAAQRQLAAQREAATLQKIIAGSSKPALARVHALWGLDAIDGGRSCSDLIIQVAEQGPLELRRQAVRQLALRQVTNSLPQIIAATAAPDAPLRCQAAIAFGKLGRSEGVAALWPLLREEDLFLRYSAFTALNRIGRTSPEAWPQIVAGLRSGEEKIRKGAEFAVRETHHEKLQKALGEFIGVAEHPAPARETALRLLAETAFQRKPWQGEWWAYHPAKTPAPKKTESWKGTAFALAMLREQLRAKEERLRQAALEGIRLAEDANSSAAIRALLAAESDPQIKTKAVSLLGFFKDREAIPLLRFFLRIESGAMMKAETLRALGQIDAETATAESVAILRGGGHAKEIVLSALETLRDTRAKTDQALLLAQAKHSEKEVRERALQALVAGHGKDAVTAIDALARSAPPGRQVEFVRALALTKSPEAVAPLLEAYAKPETEEEALLALAEIPHRSALRAYLAGLAHPNPVVRQQCGLALSKIQNQVLPDLKSMVEQLGHQTRQELARIYATNKQARAMLPSLGEIPPPEAYLEAAQKLPGQIENGRRLFFSEHLTACSKCHRVKGEGAEVGPDLSGVGGQFSRRELAESILYPSKAVREGYQSVTIETTSDESFSGLQRGEQNDSVLLLDSQGALRRIPKKEIRAQRPSELSLMPDGLFTAFSLQEFADLIAYLESLK